MENGFYLVFGIDMKWFSDSANSDQMVGKRKTLMQAEARALDVVFPGEKPRFHYLEGGDGYMLVIESKDYAVIVRFLGELGKQLQLLNEIAMSPELLRYAVAITQRSRNHNSIRLGAGPRATQGLVLSSRAKAALEGRDHVLPEDVRAMALACMEHRLILHDSFIDDGLTCAEVIRHIIESVDVPG